MRRLISVLLVFALVFSGCSKEEVIRYDLVICDNSLSEVSEFLNSFESETYIVETADFASLNADEILAVYRENIKSVNSITVYSENISDETAAAFISFAEDAKVPVIFSIADMSAEVLESYDKAFSIKTDYTHAAEMAAEKMTEYWKKHIILDSDDNLIFKFAVVKDAELSADMQDFLDTLIADIELYGIPMQLSETVISDDISSAEELEELKHENEGIIVISDGILPLIAEYSAENDGVEIITVTNNTENDFSGDFTVLNCFVDYTQYKKAADELVDNYNNREYLLNDISFPYIEKAIYIPATV
ncbi:MAG: hypothetical protein E7488_04695 [Ruminococcaceae bacterium]|nr:hypothetical protein [Oscillospiraceae bacterium]